MTATGLLVGILAGIGIIALGLGIFFVITFRNIMKNPERFGDNRAAEKNGFKAFEAMATKVLKTAAVQSYVTAEIPIHSPEIIIRVAGKKADVNSYKLEVRLGYKREEHLKTVEEQLLNHKVEYTRTDKGRGLIKLVTGNVLSVEELMTVAKAIKTALTYDLDDGSIGVTKSLRKQ